MATAAVVRVLEREARVYRRLWRGSVFTNFATPLLFLAALGLGVGDLVDESRGEVAGLDYLSFVAAGLLAASAMQSAAAESLWPVMAGFKWVGFYHGVVASPVSAVALYGGRVLWVGARTVISSAAFLVVAALMGAVDSPLGVLAVPAAVLTAMAFAAPLTAYAATQESDVPFVVVVRMGIVPLFLFSGTFFPIELLPAVIRPVAYVSPLWHGVELCRAATTGMAPAAPAVVHVAALLAITGAGFVWGTRAFPRRLTQ